MSNERLDIMIQDVKYAEKVLKGLCYYSSAYNLKEVIQYLEKQKTRELTGSGRVLKALLKGGK